MSRFTKAMDLESWRHRQGGGPRKRRKGKGSKRRDGHPEPREVRGAPRQPDLVKAIPLPPKRHKPGQDRRGRDALRGDEDTALHEAELAEGELEQDLGEEPAQDRRKLKDRVHDAVTRDWQKPIDLGANMRIQTRPGMRAAVIEVKPGLFVIAEVPTESVEFGFGPMLLAPALIKTLGRALQGQRSAAGAGRAHRPGLSTQPAPKQLPGPAQGESETSGLAPWLDQDIAEELGCPCELPAKRRQP